MPFAFQRAFHGPRTSPGNMSIAVLPALVIARGLVAYPVGISPAPRRRQFHSSPARLGQTDGDGLLRRTRAVSAFADMMKFFAHKFARLSGRRFSFAPVFARPFDGGFLRHKKLSFDF